MCANHDMTIFHDHLRCHVITRVCQQPGNCTLRHSLLCTDSGVWCHVRRPHLHQNVHHQLRPWSPLLHGIVILTPPHGFLCTSPFVPHSGMVSSLCGINLLPSFLNTESSTKENISTGFYWVRLFFVLVSGKGLIPGKGRGTQSNTVRVQKTNGRFYQPTNGVWGLDIFQFQLTGTGQFFLFRNIGSLKN